MSTTLTTLLERVALIAFEGESPIKSTASGTATSTTWKDANVFYRNTSSNSFKGNALHWLTDNSNSDAAVDQERRVTTFDGADDLTIEPAWTTLTPAANDVGLMYYHGVSATNMKEAINQIVRNLLLPRYSLTSLTADPNMEDSGTTGYTSLGGSPTISKATNCLTGTQSLSIQSASDGDGVKCESALVDDTFVENWGAGTFYVSVILKVQTGAVDVIFGGLDASSTFTAVKTVAVTQRNNWVEVRFAEAAPSNVERVQLRIADNGGSGSDGFLIDSVSLLHSEQQHYKLPAEITNAAHIEGMMELPQGAATEESDVYIPLARDFYDLPYTPLRDFAAVHPQRITLPRPTGRPYWVRYRAAGTAPSSLTDTIPLTGETAEVVVYGAAARVFELMANGTDDREKRDFWIGKKRMYDGKYHAILRSEGLDKTDEPKGQRRVLAR